MAEHGDGAGAHGGVARGAVLLDGLVTLDQCLCGGLAGPCERSACQVRWVSRTAGEQEVGGARERREARGLGLHSTAWETGEGTFLCASHNRAVRKHGGGVASPPALSHKG
jgi:hypothetical protein